MGDPYTYRAPVAPAASELKEQGSRFLAHLAPCPEPAAAAAHLESLRGRYHDATHHCWAWRCGWGGSLAERSADAGEPRGTAGALILRTLQEAGVSDASLVVVRYFGGVKLGTGGLARAYRESARAALAGAVLEARALLARLSCEMPYGAQGAFRHLAAKAGATLSEGRFGEGWSVVAAVPLDALPAFEARLAELREAWKGAVRWRSK